LLPEDYGFLWIPYALPKALELARGANIDVIWTSSPPHNLHIVGLIVHKMSGIPWVVDLRDGWYGNPLFTPKLFVRQRFEYWLENLVMRNASHIITRVHSLKDDLYQRYGTETLISTVPNGFDPEDFDSEYVVRLGKSLRRQKFTLTHVGLLGGNRSPEVLFKAIYRLTQYRPNAFCDFQFVNVGGIEQKWLGFAAGLGIDALIVDIPNVPHREAIAYMLASDALWLIQVALDGGERAIPSKTYEYLAARKPIVASVCQGATRDLLEFTGGAFLVEPDDQESLLHILMTLYDHWRSEPDSLKHFQSNWNLVRQMTRQHSAERLVQIFNEISHP
jgi:glycosyltransferase involved in cell wall biosynthesis